MILLANLLRRRAVSVQEHDVPADAVGDWASEVSTQRAIADIFEDAISFLDFPRCDTDRAGRLSGVITSSICRLGCATQPDTRPHRRALVSPVQIVWFAQFASPARGVMRGVPVPEPRWDPRRTIRVRMSRGGLRSG